MRKILSILVAIAFVLVFFCANAQAAYRYVKVSGRQLLVDFDMNGTYEPFVIKGVGYSPYPIGTFPGSNGTCQVNAGHTSYNCGAVNGVTHVFDRTQLLDRDFALLAAIGVNTIRTWDKVTQTLLDKAQIYGIKVIAGFWIQSEWPHCDGSTLEYYDPPFLTNPTERQNLINNFSAYVNQFKNHPAILFWSIGNENNLQIRPSKLADWYTLINAMALAAHQTEDPSGGTNYHPVAVVNGDILNIGEQATDDLMTALDIWGANVFRGISFGNLFNDFALKSSKPLWISEYGIDSRDMDSGNDTVGQLLQAQWVGGLWDEIKLHPSLNIGATIMEYSDEWWKTMVWDAGGNPDFLDSLTQEINEGSGCKDSNCDGSNDWCPKTPDQFLNEESWGMVKIAPDGADANTVDDISPKEVACRLFDRFKFGYDVGNHYYAGPENNKTCDGTRTCCSSSSYLSKDGTCVSNCNTPGSNPSGCSCFLAGTPVLMADGSSKSIERLKPGDRVMAFDEKTNRLKPDVVKEFFKHSANEYLIINGYLKVTPNHPVYSKGKWIEIGKLKLGEKLVNSQGQELTIDSIKEVKKKVKVYNLEVNPYHTYIAGNIVVHNKIRPCYQYQTVR